MKPKTKESILAHVTRHSGIAIETLGNGLIEVGINDVGEVVLFLWNYEGKIESAADLSPTQANRLEGALALFSQKAWTAQLEEEHRKLMLERGGL